MCKGMLGALLCLCCLNMYATTRCFYTRHKIIHSGPYLTERFTVKLISEICKDSRAFSIRGYFYAIGTYLRYALNG